MVENAESAVDPIVKSALDEAIEAKLKAIRAHTGSAERSLVKYERLRQLFKELDFTIPEAPPEEVAAEQAPLKEATASEIEQAENLIRQARVHAMRGDRDGAKRLLDQAAELAPGSATVLEALGDELREQKRNKQAIEYYAKAMALGPKNVALEKKHAELTFSALAATQAFSVSASDLEAVASAKASVIMSLLVPGLGQIVAGRVATGLTFLAGWLTSWVFVRIIGFESIAAVMTGKNLHDGSSPRTAVLLPLAIAIGFHLTAIINASSSVRKPSATKPLHPRPPSDLPFE